MEENHDVEQNGMPGVDERLKEAMNASLSYSPSTKQCSAKVSASGNIGATIAGGLLVLAGIAAGGIVAYAFQKEGGSDEATA